MYEHIVEMSLTTKYEGQNLKVETDNFIVNLGENCNLEEMYSLVQNLKSNEISRIEKAKELDKSLQALKRPAVTSKNRSASR